MLKFDSKYSYKKTYVNYFCVLSIQTGQLILLSKLPEVNLTRNTVYFLRCTKCDLSPACWPFLYFSIKVASHSPSSAHPHWQLGRIGRQHNNIQTVLMNKIRWTRSWTYDIPHNTGSLHSANWLSLEKQEDDNYLQAVVNRLSDLGTVPSSLPLKGKALSE